MVYMVFFVINLKGNVPEYDKENYDLLAQTSEALK